MKFISKILNSRWGIFLMLAFLLAINVIASLWHSRIDLTDEKRFTLSKGTELLLNNIDEPITIDVFLKGNYPSGFKKLASATEDLLREFKEVAGNKLKYRFISPEDILAGTTVSYADTLTSMGLLPINLTAQKKDGQEQQNVFPIALLHQKDKIFPVEIYKGKTPIVNVKEVNNAEALLEFNIANGIAKLNQKTKIKIAYAIGNGEPMDYSVYDLAEQTLKPDFDLSLIDINQQPFISPEFKSLILLKPKLSFTETEKLKIDQYVMNGGKLLFFIDRLNAEMDSLQIKNEVVAYDRDLNLNDLLFKYGVRVNPNLIMDLQCDYLPFDINGNGQFELLPWNYFPVIESAENHPINKNLGYVSGRFVNSIDMVEAEGITKTVLLHSSLNSRIIASPALISGKENSTAPEDNNFKTANVPIAVLLEGKFKSLFSNRLSNEMNDSLKAHHIDFLSSCPIENKMLVVSDGDILMNSVVKGNQPLPMGMNPYTYGSQRQFPFANKDFLLNALDYLINENNLTEAKSKDYAIRFLDPKKINAQKFFWQLMNIVLPIFIVILFALIFQFFRKRKYSR
ncbi:MAG: gliding motility-associated ABC transporter substrate-binding protein GldG [Bacteroidota bacterium]